MTAARRALLVRFALAGPPPRVDVGADHGRVAAALGAIATERLPHRAGDPSLRWVWADGLRPFRAVGTAVIAGMGARSIARILGDGPPVSRAILHAQDDPRALRIWLAANGWAVVDEALAPEGRGFAEVVAAERGREAASGLALEYGPVLLASDDPWLVPHLRREIERLSRAARRAPDEVRASLEARASFLADAASHAEARRATGADGETR